MTTAMAFRPAPRDADPGPTAGAVARDVLAGSAARVAHRLGVLTHRGGGHEVASALAALGALRTALRSLRPVLDKGWAVELRAGLDTVKETLAEVAHLDAEVRLLVECGAEASPPARALLAERATERVALLASAMAAVGPATWVELIALGRGRATAPLRTRAPLGDAHLPAEFVLPAALRRRWRKLVKETAPQDVAMVARRAAKLLVLLELTASAGIRVCALAAATTGLLAAVAGAERAADAGRLRRWLPECPARDRLDRIAAGDAVAARRVAEALSELAALGHLIPTGDSGPAKVGGGGIVARAGRGEPEVLLVHRVRHGDWSLPKGVALPGETAEACAVREVREETGLRCRLGQEVRSVTYRDRNKRSKQVRYWHMTPLGTVGVPDPAEIDDTLWVPLSRAATLLTRGRDLTVLDAFRREHGRPARPTGR